jgi:hypothetical protein
LVNYMLIPATRRQGRQIETRTRLISWVLSSVVCLPDGDTPQIQAKHATHDLEELAVIQSEVDTFLSQLKVDKSHGLDNLHPRFLREVAKTISAPLTVLKISH